MLRTLLEERFHLRARSDQSPAADPCGAMSMANAMVRGRLNVHGLELRQLAIMAGPDLGGPVIDETRLTGAFDWDLKFTPRNFLGRSFNRERFPTIDPDGPGLATALEEQLSLKLQRRRVPRDTLVVEHVERPAAD